MDPQEQARMDPPQHVLVSWCDADDGWLFFEVFFSLLFFL